tara:strand:- start:418 stop:1053 length:636 start_codon:yes stop_codon:yes gene_type:complete
MTVWFSDPMELFRNDKLWTFWPTNDQNPNERVNASTRFILYAAVALYLINRDIRIFILSVVILSVMFFLYKNNVISRPTYASGFGDCQEPTFENPMGNVLPTDFADRPDRPTACYAPSVKNEIKRYLDDTIPYDAGRSRSALPSVQRYVAARQFYTNPNTMIPNDQTSFAEFCYGKKHEPMCKDDPSVCNPNARGVQLKAFEGLDMNSNRR